MTVPDLLLAFMGAAVALAGFAGIVALIDRGAARVSPELASFRVRSLVWSALWTIVLSVVPMLAILSNAPRGVWPVACVVCAACVLCFLITTAYSVQRFRLARAMGIRIGGAYVMALLAVGVLVLLAAGALGAVSASGAYATGVFWFLLSAAVNFSRLVFALDDGVRNAWRRNEAAAANGAKKPEQPPSMETKPAETPAAESKPE